MLKFKLNRAMFLVAVFLFIVPFSLSATSYDTANKYQYFTMNSADVSGSVLVDGLGNQNGTIVGSLGVAVGQVNESLDFASDADEITTGIPQTMFNANDDFTIMVWAWSRSQSTFRGVFGNLNGANNNGMSLVQFNDAGTYRWHIWDGGWRNTGVAVVDETWTHLALVHTGSSANTEIYVNGVSVFNITSSFTDSIFGLTIGNMYSSVYTETRWDGLLDEFLFTEEALNLTQVTDAYSQGFNNLPLFSASEPPAEPVENSITIVSPTNQTWVYGDAVEVQITTVNQSICKYSEDSGFDFSTEGTLFSSTDDTNHTFNVNATGSIQVFNYTYKCNNSLGNLTESSLHYFKGQDTKWNNTFHVISDSILQATPYVSEDNRMSASVANYLNATYDLFGMVQDNQAVGGSCLSDYGDVCSLPERNAMVGRYQTDLVERNPRYSFLMPNINDDHFDVPVSEYMTDLNTILDAVSNMENTTLIMSTLHGATIGTHDYDQTTQALYNSKVREQAILRNIPFLEWHFIHNHNLTNLHTDEIHLSQTGNNQLNSSVVAVIENLAGYTMTESDFNIYHDCNNEISVLNYSMVVPTASCADATTTEWVVLSDLNNTVGVSGFTITRADADFNVSITGLFEADTVYTVTSDAGSVNYTSDGSGNLLDLAFVSGDSQTVTFEVVGAGCEPNWSCSEYSACNELNVSSCVAVVDNNSCGDVYGGDYSEFEESCVFCTPNWYCDGYGACDITDTAPCNETTDLNVCNQSYSGDFSEFDAQDCNYCSIATSNTLSSCYWGLSDIWGLRDLNITNTNYDICCNATNIDSDCLYLGFDFREFIGHIEINGTAYPDDCGTQYVSEDTALIIVDIFDRVLIGFFNIGILIGIVVMILIIVHITMLIKKQ